MKNKKRNRSKLLSILRFWEKKEKEEPKRNKWQAISYYKNNRV